MARQLDSTADYRKRLPYLTHFIDTPAAHPISGYQARSSPSVPTSTWHNVMILRIPTLSKKTITKGLNADGK